MVKRIETSGGTYEITLHEGADPQALLARLIPDIRVERFEVARPSLHDIFVRIVRDHPGGTAHA